MKIQYASDLHLEFAENRFFIEDGGIEPVGEVLVLAGDVSYLGDKNMMKKRFFDWCAERFKETLIVPGNHEFYHGYDIGQIYGHTHFAGGSGSKIGETTLLCNQLGYVFYGEHRKFDANKVVEI